jgi:hypothetical protein
MDCPKEGLNTRMTDRIHLLRFAEACEKAKAQCPQYQAHDWTRDILVHKVPAANIFAHFARDDILWNKGYSQFLPLHVREVFGERANRIVEMNEELGRQIEAGAWSH